MENSRDSWGRKYYAASDDEAFLFYVAIGDIAPNRPLDVGKYRTNGVPAGFDLMAYDKTRHGDSFAWCFKGYPWEQLIKTNPALARDIQQAPGYIVVRGSRKNPETLDYLRDCIGLLTFLIDNGACAIYDPQILYFWPPDEWREQLFEPRAPSPHRHAVILQSEEDSPDQVWLHTRGMRKFGRPDISVRDVGAKYRKAATDLCHRFIDYQAFGGVILEGSEISMGSLPPGGRSHHCGDLDDPDFNNKHVEIIWPEPGLKT